MLLIIDNYDSFTYNLVQYLGELGETIEVRRNDRVTVAEIETELRPERIVISPGPGTQFSPDWKSAFWQVVTIRWSSNARRCRSV